MPRQPPLLPALAEALKGARRVAVLGVGSDLRGDDAAGVLVARRLTGRRATAPRGEGVAVAGFVGGAAPENVTGAIRRFAPDLVVLVDAAFLEKPPGTIEVLPRERIVGLTFSTHMLPASIVLDYLERTTGCRTVIVAIQALHRELLAPPSPPVMGAVRRLTAAFGTELGLTAAPCGAIGKPRQGARSGVR